MLKQVATWQGERNPISVVFQHVPTKIKHGTTILALSMQEDEYHVLADHVHVASSFVITIQQCYNGGQCLYLMMGLRSRLHDL